MNRTDIIKAGIFGVVTGDALGVPVEFKNRASLQLAPVTDMREYGTHRQPKGTWSDDSSMMFATMDSMEKCGGIDYADIMTGFVKWSKDAEYTPYGRVFDMGITCVRAIDEFRDGVNPLDCGCNGERDNGNGSLMRIMPVSLYCVLKEDFLEKNTLKSCVDMVQNVSRLTHAHPRSMIGCVIYTFICYELIHRGEKTIAEAVEAAMADVKDFYEKDGSVMKDPAFRKELERDAYGRMGDVKAFKALPEREISSSGYVVHTLEAAVWCLLNTADFAECTLKAVNLGEDTDTVGAVAGGLAGLAYGCSSIPAEWLDVLAKKAWIDEMCENFEKLL